MKNPYRKLKYIHFWRFPGYIDFSKVVVAKTARISFNPPRLKNSIGGIYYFFQLSLKYKWVYKEKKSTEGQFLQLYGQKNCRLDHQNTFLNFAEKFNDADIIYGDFNRERNVNYVGFLKSIPLFVIWMAQMFMSGVSLYASLNVIYYILICYYQKAQLSEVFNRTYKFVVVFYDASPDENYIVQEFKNRGILTMTLQHGMYSRKNTIKSIADTAFEITGSIADYYLAWNQYTKDEAVKMGVDEKRIVVLGPPRYIDLKEPEIPILAYNNIFGVILNNSSFDEHNRRLISMANQIYDTTGFRFVVRYHPELPEAKYDSMLGEGFLSKGDNKRTIKEYAEGVSFTIISGSSVFIDLLLLKHPVYRLIVSEDDNYSSVKFNSFTTVKELQKLLKSKETENEAFFYLCDSYDVYQKYRMFFDKITYQ